MTTHASIFAYLRLMKVTMCREISDINIVRIQYSMSDIPKLHVLIYRFLYSQLANGL